VPETLTPQPMAPPVAPGSTSPATVQPQNRGQEASGRTALSMVVTALEKIAPMFPMGSKEKSAIIRALGDFNKLFGPASPDLGNAQMKMLAATRPALPQQQAQQKLGAMGMQPGAPGGPNG
jgi:hypothetical protein